MAAEFSLAYDTKLTDQLLFQNDGPTYISDSVNPQQQTLQEQPITNPETQVQNSECKSNTKKAHDIQLYFVTEWH